MGLSGGLVQSKAAQRGAGQASTPSPALAADQPCDGQTRPLQPRALFARSFPAGPPREPWSTAPWHSAGPTGSRRWTAASVTDARDHQAGVPLARPGQGSRSTHRRGVNT